MLRHLPLAVASTNKSLAQMCRPQGGCGACPKNHPPRVIDRLTMDVSKSEIPHENEIPERRRRSSALLLLGWTCARDGLAHAAGLALSLSHRRTGNEGRAGQAVRAS